jgi:hypothetical protein
MKAETSLIMFSTIDTQADIILGEFAKNLKVDLETAMQIVADRLNFTSHKKHYLVLDMSNVRMVTAEAKRFMQKPEGGLKNILGAALIASNPVSALIANIFIKTPKDFQAKFFHSKQDALEWTFKQKHKGTRTVI